MFALDFFNSKVRFIFFQQLKNEFSIHINFIQNFDTRNSEGGINHVKI